MTNADSMKFVFVAVACSLLGVVLYDRLPLPSEWPTGFTKIVSANSAKVEPNKQVSQRENAEFPDVNPELAAENLKKCSKWGLPSKDNLRLFNDFLLSYDRRLRAPVWVIEHLNPDKLAKRIDTDREKSKFHEDITLHEYFRARPNDYTRSGYDRGHMAAAANHKNSQTNLDQTFVLSNVLPQLASLNRGPWQKLESYVRWRAKKSKNLFVVSGPLYLAMQARDGNLYVTYRVLGKTQVSVPTHYFKVLLVETLDNKLELEAFVMPNDLKQEEKSRGINEFRVPIDQLDSIERSSGLIFFDQLERDKVVKPTILAHNFRESNQEEEPQKGQSD